MRIKNKQNKSKIVYKSSFITSSRALDLLKKGRILAKGESPRMMIERVVSALIAVEEKFGTKFSDMESLAVEFGKLMDQKYCVMSTPILIKRPLSACTVPSVDLVNDDFEYLTKVISKIHQGGMGTGFSLDDTLDPLSTLKKLNNIAVKSAESGKENRPVGNMATLSIYHPKILEFIQAKVLADSNNEIWKFNISIDCDAMFFDELNRDGDIVLRDGQKIKAQKVFDLIAESAHSCADPGLLFLGRMDDDNPLPGVGHYISTAPCAEVGLIKGESCQFGYLNLAKFLTKTGKIDTVNLKKAVHLMTRILDNALEISINNYSDERAKHVMLQKRKIGIGICGLADLFIKKNILYDSNEARTLALDIVTLINFESKKASHELGRIRGSFKAMEVSLENKHLSSPTFVEKKYGSLSTKYVTQKNWVSLSKRILRTRFLRHSSTTALPPTGRSAMIIDASTGIEPIFSLEEYLLLHPDLKKSHRRFLQTAKNILPNGHLHMAARVQKGVDESISKTINLHSKMTPHDIKNIYRNAWNLGLKGITIYREGSKKIQPKKLF
jgi:ribonucleoside-diphosphate reductase alpha chain